MIILSQPEDSIIPEKNKQTVKSLIKRILPYSAINKKANSPPPYSILKPETNSDSPSARSKGARFVSAKHLIIHILRMGNKTKKNPIKELWARVFKLNVNVKIKIVINTKAILTS